MKEAMEPIVVPKPALLLLDQSVIPVPMCDVASPPLTYKWISPEPVRSITPTTWMNSLAAICAETSAAANATAALVIDNGRLPAEWLGQILSNDANYSPVWVTTRNLSGPTR